MTIIDLSFLLTALFFSIYGLACAIEAGIALALIHGDNPKVRADFRPFWGITNVFLVFGFTALATLFNNALQTISRQLIPTLAVGLLGLLTRACVVLFVFYVKPGTISRGTAWLFGLTTLATPLSFTAAGAYFLTGQVFYRTLLGWLVVFTAFSGLLALGSLYARKRYRTGSLAIAEVFFSTWMLLLGSALPLAVIHARSTLNKLPVAAIAALAAFGLFLQLGKLVSKSPKNLWPYAAVLGLLAPLLLAGANRPYLIAGQMTLKQAFGAQSYASVVVIGMAVTLPFILLGFWIFSKLLSSSHPAKK